MNESTELVRKQAFSLLVVLAGAFAVAVMTWQSNQLGRAVRAEQTSLDDLAGQQQELKSRAEKLAEKEFDNW